MSFILDALKKSERERERQQQPTMMDLPYGRHRRSQPLWLLAVIGLLLLNCALLLALWWRGHRDEPQVPAAAAHAGAAPPGPPVIMAPRAAEVRPLQEEAVNDGASNSPEEISDNTAALLAAGGPAAGPPLVRPASGVEQQETPVNQPRAGAPGNNGDIAAMDGTPTLDSLGGSGALNLPELRMDVHVYSSRTNERLVFINTRKYSEGQELSEGPHLERITQDGAILSYRNQRFLLPRR